MVHINTSFNLPVALKPLSRLEKGSLLTPPPTHSFYFLADLSSLGMGIIFIHIIQIFCLKLLTFPLICDCSFLNYLNLQDWWSAVPLFEAISGEPLTLSVTREKKDTMRKLTTWPDLVLKNIHGTLSLEIRNYGITSDSGRSSAPETTVNCRLPNAIERKSIILLFDFCDIKWF